MSDVLVLCYHAVSESWQAPLAVTPERFERQLRTLSRSGYRGVTFLEAATGQPGGRSVAITFDDAFRSVLRVARPILDRYEMPATVFVPTAFAADPAPMRWPGIDRWLDTRHASELVPMSWDELAALAASGWEIGSHTRSHPRLTAIDDDSLARELGASKDDCERLLGRPCRTLAYPYGDCDARVVRAAGEAGYEAAGTLPSRFPRRADPRAFPRVGVYFADGPVRFRLKASPTFRRLRSSTAWGVVEAIRR